MKNKKESLAGVKKDDKEQSRRFVETAESLEAEKTGQAFEKAIESISKKKNSS